MFAGRGLLFPPPAPSALLPVLVPGPRILPLVPAHDRPVRAPFCLPLPPHSSRACPPLLLLSFSVRFPGRAFPHRRRPSPVSPLSRFVLPLTCPRACFHLPRRPFFPRIPPAAPLPPSAPPGPHPCLRCSPVACLRPPAPSVFIKNKYYQTITIKLHVFPKKNCSDRKFFVDRRGRFP